MGAIIKISCGNCKKEWTTNWGAGYLYGSVDVAIEALGLKKEDLPTDKMKTMEEPWIFENKIGICDKCQSIQSFPYLKLINSGKEYYTKCEVCGNDLREIEIDDKIEEKCPVCGNFGLDVEKTGYWD